jgi:predicted membrane protein
MSTKLWTATVLAFSWGAIGALMAVYFLDRGAPIYAALFAVWIPAALGFFVGLNFGGNKAS